MNWGKNIYKIIFILLFSVNFALTQLNHHLESSSFPLTGSHSNVQCTSCHTQPELFDSISRNCESCHLKTFIKSSNPNHFERLYSPSLCANCHSDVAWSPQTFIHDLSQSGCVACHSNNLITANTIIAGHETLANDCTLCHVDSQWDTIEFDHSNTKYSLKDNQKILGCTSCHQNGFMGAKVVCDSCSNSGEVQIK